MTEPSAYQYFCRSCGYERDGLLDHAAGIGGYSWACPKCKSDDIGSREVKMTNPVRVLRGAQAVCSPIAMLTRDEWLQRYRAYMHSRCPGLDEDSLAELTSHEVYDDLACDYPDNPERAIDNELDGFEGAYGVSVQTGPASL